MYVSNAWHWHMQIPFALLATAYRRKRIMEGLLSGDRGMTAQIAAMAEEEKAEGRCGHILYGRVLKV